MRVLGFGTYDASRQPRVAVLLEGLAQLGAEVEELNIPLGFTTAERVEMLHRPWLLYRLLVRLAACWARLASRRTRLGFRPDVVVVGYLGQFDVLLARALFPRGMIVLDLLVFADDTAKDRGVHAGARTRLLGLLDRAAIRCASVIVVDTEEHLALLRSDQRAKSVVAPVGASDAWFVRPTPPRGGPLRVIFFGLFTPLQGAPVIGAALAALPSDLAIEVTLVGTGQDYDITHERVGDDPRMHWRSWVPMADLPELVASHDVCLGIFGTSDKALRVVPTKVYQGAAAGCAIVTSDTEPQRRMLGAAARYVAPGDPAALADVLEVLVADPDQVTRLRAESRRCAEASFRSAKVAEPLAAAVAAASERKAQWTP